jgi:hypothetical protein
MSFPKTVNIIGDVAGRFGELMELLAKMPAADLTLAVGDIVDRGPKSREVVEWFMGDPLSRDCILGNHECMFVYACRNQPMDPLNTIWGWNGGQQTWASYGYELPPESHLRWLEKRPLWYCQPGLFVSHAPVYNMAEMPQQNLATPHEINDLYNDDNGWVWNRYLGTACAGDGDFYVYGHNSHLVKHTTLAAGGEQNWFAACIDDSRHNKLTGLHWPTKEIYQVEYHR